MTKLKIVSGGKGQDTIVYLDGARLENVRSVSWSVSGREARAICQIEFIGLEVEINADVDLIPDAAMMLAAQPPEPEPAEDVLIQTLADGTAAIPATNNAMKAKGFVRGADGQWRPKCENCDGCGQIADDAEGAPWTAWTSLPVGAQMAIRMGMLKPIVCPECFGAQHKVSVQKDTEAAT